MLRSLASERINEMLGPADGEFSLSAIHDFPEQEYLDRKAYYANLENWYRGEFLNETQVQGRTKVEKYPVKLNPIRGAVYKHAYALFGEVRQDSAMLAQPILRPDDRKLKEQARTGQEILTRIWSENNGRTLMMRNAMLSQYLGGCVFKVSYVPEQKWRRVPIRIEAIHPANFVGIPMAGDEFRLERSWIVRPISVYEANRVYGVELDLDPESPNVYYIEYWTPEYYEYSINGIHIPMQGKYDSQGRQMYFAGPNPYGMVPTIYIPHIRTASFYGDSLISNNVQGIVEEINRREADRGDAVSEDSHRTLKLTGTSQRPDVYEAYPGTRIVQVSSGPAVTGKEQQADIDQLGQARASAPMQELSKDLYMHFRREAFIPPVADGEDEGSQRSGQTLAMRMWPLISHTTTERIYWSDGLAQVDQIILTIIRVSQETDEKLGKLKLPPETEDMAIARRWAPILPRDRTEFANELISRASSKLGSLRHLMSLIDDIDDPEGELEAIREELKLIAKVEAETQMQLKEKDAEIADKQLDKTRAFQAQQAEVLAKQKSNTAEAKPKTKPKE